MATPKNYLSEFEMEWRFNFDSQKTTSDEFESTTYEDGTNYDFENRLYSIITNNYKSELEFEQQLNRVLYEIEKDYFFKSLKKKTDKPENISVYQNGKSGAYV